MTWSSLYPYQQEGVNDLLSILKREDGHRGALLADPPGAGKTAQATHVALGLHAQRILVLCPASLRENWRRELQRWSEGQYIGTVLESSKDLEQEGFKFPDVVVCSYSLSARGPVLDALRQRTWDLMICDESHMVKSASSQCARAVLVLLWASSRYRLCMTGTPLPNGRAAEAWTVFSRMNPEAFGSWVQFKERYCIEETTPWGTHYPQSKNLQDLKDKARKFMVRRPKDVILKDLPALVRMTVPLRVPELEVFDIQNGLDIEAIVRAVELGIPLDRDPLSTARRKLGLLKVERALEYIEELFEESPEGSRGGMVVFAHHREVFQGLQEGLQAQGFTVVGVNGLTPPEERQKCVDQFQAGEADIFLASLRAAGVGLTLTRSSVCVMVEADWVPSVNLQAEARIHRLTQKDICRAIYLVVPESLDEMVLRVVQRKQKNIDRVMEA